MSYYHIQNDTLRGSAGISTAADRILSAQWRENEKEDLKRPLKSKKMY